MADHFPAFIPRIYDQLLNQAAANGFDFVPVYGVEYANFNEYYNGIGGGFDPFEFRDNLVQANANPHVHYYVIADFVDHNNDVVVHNNQEFLNHIKNNMGLDSAFLDLIFNQGAPFRVDFGVHRMQPRANVPLQGGAFYNFMANSSRSRFWGPLGKVNNCVVQQVSSQV